MSKLSAVLNDLLWLKVEQLSGEDMRQLKQVLTYTPKVFEDGGEPPKPIQTYRVSEDKRSVGVPPVFGLRLCRVRNIIVQERFAKGFDIAVRKCPVPWEEKVPGQGQFFNDTLNALLDRHFVLTEAGTGTGKTANGCNAIYKLGASTTVVVPTVAAADHWQEQLQLHNGFKPDEIGMIGDGECSWEGKPVVIMLLHSAASKDLPREFFDSYLFNIFDEAHRLGAATFSQCLKRFRGQYRLALSATPERKDGCTGIVTDYFGLPSSILGSDAQPCDVHTRVFQRKFWGRTNPNDLPPAILINIISKDKERNRGLARDIAYMRGKGRYVLGLGDRIDQLTIIRDLLLNEHGLAPEEVGIFADEKLEGDKRVKVTKEERARVRKFCTVILATLGSMKEAVDVPRLDCGFDLTPVADGTQMIGRIRRPMKGKKRPVWITTLDSGIGMLKGYYLKRLRLWAEANCDIIDPVK